MFNLSKKENQKKAGNLNGKSSVIILMLIASALIAIPARAQQPFQDAKGEGTVFINDGGFAQFNVADSSIRLGYLRDLSTANWVFGFNLSGKPTGTRAGLISSNQAVPEAQGNFTIGYRFGDFSQSALEKILITGEFRKKLQKFLVKAGLIKEGAVLPEPKTAKNLAEYLPELTEAGLIERRAPLDKLFDLPELKLRTPKFRQLAFQGGYGFKQYRLYNPAAAFDDQVYKKNFHSPSAQLIYFEQVKPRLLFGAGIGVRRSNNSDDLTEIEVRDFTTTTSGGTTREVARVRKALRGDFKQFTEAFINTDLIYFPKQLDTRIGINFFTRSGLTGTNKGFRPGIGLFFSQAGAPTKVIGGISLSVAPNGKADVGLIAGYSF